jgi:hypothetical protein
MRLRLEFEDVVAFSTISGGPLGDYRALMVKINGKPFSVWRTLDVANWYLLRDDKHYVEEIDKALVAAMERMLEKVFMDACAAIPEGTDLMIGPKS